jgi:sarcosine oxidase subunit alpha
MHWHCDALVVGAGPAGLAAALPLARAGQRLVLVEEAGELSDQKTAAELDALPNVLVLRRTSVFGYYDHNFLIAVERRTDHLGPAALPALRASASGISAPKRVVLATGAHERPITFGNNDLPGIVPLRCGPHLREALRRVARTARRRICKQRHWLSPGTGNASPSHAT